MKYFLMGAFATGFLVYGIALVYGTTGGELSYAGIAANVNKAARAPLFFLGEYFILVALAFKVAAVPFHMWAPDAYEGAPTPVTGFMAAGVKAAAFGAIVRILGTAFASPVLVFDVTGWANILACGRRDHDDARQPGRHPAGERQAHARVLVDRARRVPAAGRGGVGPGRRQREAGRAVLPGHLHLHDAGRVRRGRLDRQPQGRAPVRRRLGGRRLRAAGRRPGDDDLPAVAGRRAADGRLLRQVLPVQGRDGVAAALLAGRARRC